jgi:large subunit ribosomal protein L4
MASKLNAKLVDAAGAHKGDLELDSEVFVHAANAAVVYEAVRYQLLKKRAGTHSCLTKGEMKGGGKKPWKQKGTGRARSGSNTSPVWVGGAVAHGPKPRSYENRTMKRTRRDALVGVISDKARNGGLFCFESLQAQKSKEFAALLNSLALTDKKVLFVTEADKSSDPKSSEVITARAARNVNGVKIVGALGLNTYDVINSDAVLLSKSLFEKIQQDLKQASR